MNNDRIKILTTEALSNDWYVLNKVTYDFKKKSGEWQTHAREAYDRGNWRRFFFPINQSAA